MTGRGPLLETFAATVTICHDAVAVQHGGRVWVKKATPILAAVVVALLLAGLGWAASVQVQQRDDAAKTLALTSRLAKQDQAQIRGLAADDAAARARAAADEATAEALAAQLFMLGARPVATPSSEGGGATVPGRVATGSPAPAPSPPVTNPAGHTPPGRQCTVNVLGVCVP